MSSINNLLDRLLYSAVWGTNDQADSSPTVQYCAGQTACKIPDISDRMLVNVEPSKAFFIVIVLRKPWQKPSKAVRHGP